jgi:hypothetical protein
VERRRAQLEESVARYLSQLDTADRQEPTEALAREGNKAYREADEAEGGNGQACRLREADPNPTFAFYPHAALAICGMPRENSGHSSLSLSRDSASAGPQF